jgi:hypothetical protein
MTSVVEGGEGRQVMERLESKENKSVEADVTVYS